ncbi:MAG: hypothetical protein GY729_02845 [Desulfobacteraceae bacterium]|nr:hypothetical protein [Desulfobacteraceae bacterium]
MKKDEDIGIIPSKESHSPNRTLFIKTYVKLCVPLSVLGFIFFGMLNGNNGNTHT